MTCTSYAKSKHTLLLLATHRLLTMTPLRGSDEVEESMVFTDVIISSREFIWHKFFR